MKKRLLGLLAVVMTLATAVAAVPASAAEGEALPAYCDVLDVNAIPAGASYAEANAAKNKAENGEVYLTEESPTIALLANAGKADCIVEKPEDKNVFKFDNTNQTGGQWMEGKFNLKTVGKEFGAKGPAVPEKIFIYADFREAKSDSVGFGFVISEVAYDKDGKALTYTNPVDDSVANTMAFWTPKLGEKFEVYNDKGELQEIDGQKEQTVSAGQAPIKFSAADFEDGFVGYIAIKPSALTITWEDATGNKAQIPDMSFNGANVTRVDYDMSVPGGQSISMGNVTFGYNGWTPATKDAKKVDVVAATGANGNGTTLTFEKPVESTPEDSKAEDSKVEESKPADTTSTAKPADTTSTAKPATQTPATQTPATSVPKTADAGVVSMAAVLLVAAGAAVVVAKRK